MFERREGETEFQYHKRLIYGKLVDKTLADVDYTELAPYVYGKEFSADVARRCMYGSRMTLELLDRDAEDRAAKEPDVADRIKEQRVELAKERQRFFDQRREYHKMLAADGRREHLEERLVNAAMELAKTVGPLTTETRPALFTENEAVLVLSDWHYGMVTKNVFNEYNTEICKRRVNDIVDSASARIQLHGCKTLHVVVLGDLFHGAIHTSARVMSEELACDQLMQASEILARAIARLSTCVEKTIVYMTYGNHARTVQSKNDSVHRDNMERIIPWWLRQRFSGAGNIEIADVGPYEYILMDICGRGFCAAHGDLDSIHTSPRLLTALFQKRFGVELDYILLGDKHHTESFGEIGVEAIMVDSLCGTDDYANEKRLYSTPGQLLLVVNPEQGIDARYRIRCS